MTIFDELKIDSNLRSHGVPPNIASEYLKWARNRLHQPNRQMHSIMEGIREALMPKQ